VSFVLVAVVVMATMSIQDVMTVLKGVPAWIWLVAFSFVILIEYFILHMSFGWYAKTCLKSLENKKRLN
jgi:Tfp pilus assembly protein PilO